MASRGVNAIDIENIYINPTEFQLNNGIKMPSLGVGLNYFIADNIIKEIVDIALNKGYRLFDTSPNYGNERRLMVALRELLPKYKLKRSDVFITTKLNPADYGDEEGIERSFNMSFENLGSEYIDLYLIEYPGQSSHALIRYANNTLLEVTWMKLIELYEDGKVNALGVSNFNIDMLEKLSLCNHGVIPAVNKVEWHPFYSEKNLYSYCNEKGILIQAYSTLDCPFGVSLLEDSFIMNMAGRLNIATSELIMGWTLQRGVALIPRSVSLRFLQIENIPAQIKISLRDIISLDTLTENCALDGI